MEVFDTQQQLCNIDGNTYSVLGFSKFTDANGTVHLPNGLSVAVNDPCIPFGPGSTGPLNDGSGWSYLVTQALSIDFLLPDGTVIEPLHLRCTGSPSTCTSVGGGTIRDANGNLLYTQLNPNPNQVVDTIGTPFAVGGDYWTIQSLGYTDSNGSAQTVGISYRGGVVQTNYGCSGLLDFPVSALGYLLVSKVSYADGSSESFAYEPTPGFPSSTTGRIASITLRTGGTINFAYTGTNDGINCNDGSMAGITVTTSDGVFTFQRSVSGATSTTTVISPATATSSAGDQMVLTFFEGFETQRKIYQGSSSSGTLLETVTTCYNGNKTNCTTATPKLPITEVSRFTTLSNGLQNEQDSFFNSTELNTEIDEYDFGSNGPGSLLRRSLTAYTTLGNNIIKAASVTVCSNSGSDPACSGSGTKIAQSTYGYDEYDKFPLTATSNLPQHSTVSGSRGNLTSSHHWLSTTGNTVDILSTFDDAGRILTSTDANKNQTTFGYDCNDAYISKVTLPSTTVGHVTSITHDCNTGLVMSATDQNNQPTSYLYDAVLRPTQVNFPDGGQTSISYPTVNQAVTQRKIDSSRSTYSTSLVDGYARISRTAVANGESTPYDQQDFCYDSKGLLSFKSYPYQGNSPVFSGAPVCSGAGDTFVHDPLSRLTSVAHSDGTSQNTTYNGRAVQITDEGNGSFNVSRILQTDGLGRLTNVCELYSGAALLGSGGTPASCGLDISGTGLLTTYGHDLLGNLTSVTQGSVNGRTFAYDSLSRLLCAANPEVGGTAACPNPDNGSYTPGTIRFSYDANGNLQKKIAPAPNQIGTTTVTTTYGYDVLNRLTSKSYSDGTTPTANFFYDTDPGWGNPTAPATNVIGRLSQASNLPNGGGAQIFGYDKMGRVVMNNQCTPLNCGSGSWPVGYTYDLLGDVTSATNGAGVTLNYSYNIAGRMIGVASSLNDANHPPTLLSGVHYSPSVTTDNLGNGVVETTNRSPRGLLQSYQASLPGGQPGAGSITVSGTLQTYQQQTQPATPASVTVTIGGSDATVSVRVCVPNGHGGQTCTTTPGRDSGTISVTVTAGGNSVTAQTTYNSNSTTSGLATALYNAFPSNSLATMSNPNGSSSFTLTTIATGPSANNTTVSAGVASSCRTNCTITGGGWTMTPSQANFSGGANAVFQPAFDNGSTTVTVNSHASPYFWSGSSTTPASIGQGVCNAINADTAAFVTAAINGISNPCPLGTTVALVAKGGSGTDYTLSASSNSVANSFSVGCPGFPDCSNASLTGTGNAAYSLTLGYAPDAEITSANDLTNGNWSFSYDAFNRLASSNKNSNQQTFNYNYDAQGNRWQQDAPQGGPAPQYTFDNNNHFIGSGVTYDAAGHVLTDGLGNSFTWDAEDRLIEVQQGSTVVATYMYDAAGYRTRGPNGGTYTT
jgi:YD repeat-containing protein